MFDVDVKVDVDVDVTVNVVSDPNVFFRHFLQLILRTIPCHEWTRAWLWRGTWL